MTSQDFFNRATALQARIIRGESNETPVMAWAAVCRACANASNAKRNEIAAIAGPVPSYTRAELNWFNNLERVWWVARAQVETLAEKAAA